MRAYYDRPFFPLIYPVARRHSGWAVSAGEGNRGVSKRIGDFPAIMSANDVLRAIGLLVIENPPFLPYILTVGSEHNIM